MQLDTNHIVTIYSDRRPGRPMKLKLLSTHEVMKLDIIYSFPEVYLSSIQRQTVYLVR